MFEGNKILAIIPARGGSKRLPGKNLLSLDRKPLIAWTIEAALKSEFIDEVIVSTDDLAIVETAREYGASVPFIRPSELAGDASRSIDVVLHALQFMRSEGKEFDQVILLQPTSPLRDSGDIDEGIRHYFKRQADSVIGVCEVEHNPIWSNTLPEDGSMASFIPEGYNNARSQDLPLYYRINGAFYMANTETLIREETFFFNHNIYAFVMSQEHSVDIDTELDFILATSILKLRGI